MSAHAHLRAVVRRGLAVREIVYDRAETTGENEGRSSREAEREWERAARLDAVLDLVPALVLLSGKARRALRTLQAHGDDIAARATLMDALEDLDVAIAKAHRPDPVEAAVTQRARNERRPA